MIEDTAPPADPLPMDASPADAAQADASPAVSPLPTPTPVVVRRYVRFRAEAGQNVEEPVIAEMRLRIEVDGAELVDLMCSPHRVNALVLGFLYHEGLIDGLDDVAGVRVCLPDGLAEVHLARPAPPLPQRRIITSGCTGGVSFGAYLEKLERLRLPPDDVRVAPQRVYVALRQL